MCFSPYLGIGRARGGGGGAHKGLVHNLLMQFFAPGSSKIEVFKTFFDTVITQNDHPRYVKHPYLCVFQPFWVLGVGGGGRGSDITAVCLAGLRILSHSTCSAK